DASSFTAWLRDACSGRAEGVAQRHASAVGVEVVARNRPQVGLCAHLLPQELRRLERLELVEHLRRERLVDLPQRDVLVRDYEAARRARNDEQSSSTAPRRSSAVASGPHTCCTWGASQETASPIAPNTFAGCGGGAIICRPVRTLRCMDPSRPLAS